MNEYANLTGASVLTRRNRTGRCFDHVIDGPTLMDMNRERKSFCVETLIPKGVCILGGAPKVGKSWLALDLCIRVAKGEPLWDLPTRKGTTLYLALEDSIDDLQDRAYMLTDDIPLEAHFAVTAEKLNSGLCDQIVSFVTEHPDTVLVVIDTFQVVRGRSSRAGYAGEYAEIRKLKELADRFCMTILLVHHLRKQGDSDPLNRISGSSALTGATDGVYVLTQKDRSSNDADLICAGRRIRKREMQLRFENGHWELLADSLGAPDHSLPEELQKLVAFVRAVGMYSGGNAEFAERYNSFAGAQTDAKHLKQLMQQRADDLE
ncbi:MAG: AAA family ATPase, partial [Clostridia bacterium]|nr:AAA family ATPase [Clostridia bacterium]